MGFGVVVGSSVVVGSGVVVGAGSVVGSVGSIVDGVSKQMPGGA